MRYLSIIILTLCCFMHYPLSAQTETAPAFKLYRWQENYQYLANAAVLTPYERFKYFPLSDARDDIYLSLGGEVREHWRSFRNPDFGLRGTDKDDYLLHRFYLHGDLHLGQSLRIFTQLAQHRAYGKTARLAPTDAGGWDWQQGFIDLQPASGRYQALLRVGRQELGYGSARLIGVRNNPNHRRNFDGAKLVLKTTRNQLDGFIARVVETDAGNFDDDPNDNELLWGLYNVYRWQPTQGLDTYFFRRNRDNARFASGVANDERFTVGLRWWGKRALGNGRLDYNAEPIYQFGDFGHRDIRAWAFSTDTGYTFKGAYKVRLSLKASYSSGDDNLNDETLNTFDPVYPKGSFSSELAHVGFANFYQLYPEISLSLKPQLKVALGWEFLWRAETQDAVYQHVLRALPNTTDNTEREIGHQVQLKATWTFNRHWQLFAAYVHFSAGDAITAAGGEDIDYYSARLRFRF